ncbi:unnamed protein product [Zymoseptoria tritici ST99CH_1A5]|uniref:Uncharacterized protein n=3 Tax=Zymoseptoria tritici TaxID=1047171 RepID=F9WXH1_ZYMTI|nr:uncharacterized protein MYCGRDRAFT_88695 [Zymoseptoria tritici IPO323]EGP92733.1 hypothetical protein MYCGRDRAFT_88695 [Zymoseptoria tritici IPO323]SMR41341.1 unnamed protein product [Zymoseptoria tritici ST99CH_1E4]SMY18688.1 unnamed protein product [Zymoseptoria tritici ST99CH_1A5]
MASLPAPPDGAPLPENSNIDLDDIPEAPLSRSRSLSSSPAGAAPSGSRLKNRLQLRNAGFRGPEVPTRKVTPVSVTVSNSWSNSSVMQSSGSNLSDIENTPPDGKVSVGSRKPIQGSRDASGVLQEIRNTGTVRQAKNSRSRVMSGRLFSPETANIAQDGNDSGSPVQGGSISKRTRSIRSRVKMGRPRRSISGETQQYVEHLEAELSAAQAQISALASPTSSRDQSARMRHLSAETKQLQEEIADWETKYEERIRDEVDRHFQLESSLRSRLRTMELEAEETRFKMLELASRLDNATETLNAAETANVNLEKRIEIMSEMLAASPTKHDFHTEDRSRHGRQRSMLPRFPTAGALMSPERATFNQASSPNQSRMSMPILPEAYSPDACSSDDGHPASEASMVSSSYNAFNPPPLSRTNTKRRMRRFGAGSLGPKPLILPSTSHHDSVIGSTAGMDRQEMASRLPFSMDYSMQDQDRQSWRKSSVNSYAGSFPPSLPGSPRPAVLHKPIFPGEHDEDVVEHDLNSPDEDDHEAMLDDFFESSPLLEISGIVTPTLRDGVHVSDRGANAGRNLMDELAAVQTSDPASSTEAYASRKSDSTPSHRLHSSPFHSISEAFTYPPGHTPPAGSIRSPPTITTVSTTNPRHRRLHRRVSSRSGTRSARPKSVTSLSTLDSLTLSFSNIFRNPVAMAKHLVETAQSRARIPSSLFNVQWWLVGILLGPMAKRRFLKKANGQVCCAEEAARRSLLGASPCTSPPNDDDGGSGTAMDYGTLYQTPPPSSSPPTRTHKRRSWDGSVAAKRCPHHPNHASAAQGAAAATATKRSKHSPWLWLKFSLTLAIAVGVAFKDGPGSLLKMKIGKKAGSASGNGSKVQSASADRDEPVQGAANWRGASRDPSGDEGGGGAGMEVGSAEVGGLGLDSGVVDGDTAEPEGVGDGAPG